MTDAIITADSLAKTYGTVKALNGLSLKVEQGIILLVDHGNDRPGHQGL